MKMMKLMNPDEVDEPCTLFDSNHTRELKVNQRDTLDLPYTFLACDNPDPNLHPGWGGSS